jgi:hypothetical protein
MEQIISTRESDFVVKGRVANLFEQNGFETSYLVEGMEFKKPGISTNVPQGFVQWMKDRIFVGIPADSPRRSILVCRISAICPYNDIFTRIGRKARLSTYDNWNVEVFGRNNLEFMQTIAEELSKLFAKKITVTLVLEEEIKTKFSWEESGGGELCDM